MRLHSWLTNLYRQLARPANCMVVRRASKSPIVATAMFERLELRQLLSASASAAGSEFLVNSTIVGDRGFFRDTTQSVAMDAAGDFVITWQSSGGQDGSGIGIYAQRYNAAGTAQGSEFRVNTSTVGDQIYPSVAMDAAGDFVITWTSADADLNGIYAQRFNALAVAQGSEFRVNTTTAGNQSGSVVSMDSAGNFVVTWTNYSGQDGNSYGVYAQRFTAAAVTQNGEFRVNTTTANSQCDASVSMDPAGDFVVTWGSDGEDGSGTGVYAQRYNSLGTVQGNEFRVNSYTTGVQYHPKVALDVTGDFVITWASHDGQDGNGSGIYAQRYNSSGIPQGSEFRVNTYTTGGQDAPKISVDSAGEFVVTWSSSGQDGSGYGIYSQQYSAAGLAQGTEFHVSTFTTGEQKLSTVAMNSAGDFVVTWTSDNQDGGGVGVYAQRYLAASSPIVTGVNAGASSQVTVPEVMSQTATGSENRVNTSVFSSQRFSSGAMDPAGDYVVAWSSFGQDGSSYGIYAQRYSAAGGVKGTEFKVNTYATSFQNRSSVAMDSAGDFVITWSSYGQDGSKYGIYAQRYNAAGIAQGGEFKVNTYATGQQSLSSVAMDAAGDFVIAWRSYGQDGSKYGVYAQRYDALGETVGAEFRVNTYTTGIQTQPSVAMDPTGDFVIAWMSFFQDGNGYGAYAQRYNSAGVAQGSEFQINTNTNDNQSVPEVAMDATGDFVIAWQSLGQDGSDYGIYAQRFNAVGTAQGVEFRVNTFTTNAQLWCSVAMDPVGDFVISWQSVDGSSNGVFAQRYNSAGIAQGSEFNVNTYTTLNQMLPDVAMDAAGDFVVVWESYGQDGSNYGIYSQRYIATVGSVVTVASAGPVIQNGDELTSAISALSVNFSENMNAVPGGPNSVTNPSNWRLTRFGIDVSHQISGITFALNPITLRDVAVVSFSVPLTQGGYQLISRQTIRDVTGRTLDGEADGIPGGDFGINFFVARTLSTGSETPVNTHTVGTQVRPVIATDAAGDYVITWYSNGQDGSGFGIYAQRYSAAGIAQGVEFLVNTYTTGAQISPQVAMDAAGDFVIVWESNQDGSGYGIYAQRYNFAGTPQGAEFQVNTYVTNNQRFASVAMDAAGDFVISWQSSGQDGNGYGVYARRYNAIGVAQGIEFQANTYTTDHQESGVVAMDAAGDFVIAWQSYNQDGDSWGIFAQRYDATGGKQRGEFQVNTYTTTVEGEPDVAMDAAGDFVIAWYSFRTGGGQYDVYSQRYNASGVTRGSEFRANPYTLGKQANPSVAMDKVGDFVISWDSNGQDGSGDGVYAQRYDSTGILQDVQIHVSTYTTGHQNFACVAMDSVGDFVVTWQSNLQDGSNYGIYAQRYKADVAPWMYQIEDDSLNAVGPLTTPITSSLLLFDHDNAQLTGATIQISNNYQSAEDVLGFTNTANLTGSWNALTGTLTLTGTDSGSNYRTALRSVTYHNTSVTPNTVLTRIVDFLTADGLLSSNVISRNLNVTMSTIPPVLSGVSGTATFIENATPLLIGSNVIAADVDSANLASAMVSFTNWQGEDRVSFSNIFGLQSTFTQDLTAHTASLTITGADTPDHYQTLLRSVTYWDVSDAPSTQTRVASFQVNDGVSNSNWLTLNIAVTAANDAPIGTSNTVVTPEDTSYAFATSDFGFLDPIDVLPNTLLAVQFATLPLAGGLTNNGVAVVAGSSVLATDIALGKLKFVPGANGNGATYASFQFQVQDNGGTANSGQDTDLTPRTMTLSVNAVNDASILSGVSGTGTYLENAANLLIAANLVVSDSDSVNLVSATVSFTNWQGEDRVIFNNIFALQHTLTQDLVAHTATFTITGNATVDHYQTLLRSVVYWDVTDNPVTSTRVASFTVNDGFSNSNAVFRNINLVSINDAPRLSAIEATPLAYKANDPAYSGQLISGTLLTGDSDSVNFTKAIVQISGGYQNDANGHDLLSFANKLGIIGSFDPSTGTMTLTGTSSGSNYRTAIRSVTFSSSGSAVSMATRTLTITASDDFLPTPATSESITRTVAVTITNNPPALTGLSATALSYVRGTAAAMVASSLLVLDPDSINMSSATIQIMGNYQNGQDVLAATTVTGITKSFNAATGTLTLSGIASLASYQTVLRSVTYKTNTAAASTLIRTISFTINDGVALSNPIARNVTLS